MVAAAGLALAWTSPAEAAPPTVSCGDTLTADTVLTTDLTCAGNGLTLAPGVDLDLGGHRLTGNGTGVGLTMTDATSNAVSNGVLRNWRLGIQFVSAVPFPVAPLELSDLAIREAPLSLEGAGGQFADVALRNSPVTPSFSTVEFVDSSLRSSDIAFNGELNQIVVRRSTVVGGTVGRDENNTVRVEDSVLDGTGYDGRPLRVPGGSATLVRTVVKRYAQPMSGEWPLTVTDSTFRDMPNGAIDFGYQTTITGSSFTRSGVAVSGNELTVQDSVFSKNSVGLVVTAADFDVEPSVITGNWFSYNRRNGLTAQEPGQRIGANTALRNVGYGIYAPGADDLGGNRARRNGAGQCVGVVCTP